VLDIPTTTEFEIQNVVGDAYEVHSAVSCLAWAEATLRNRPIGHFWTEFEHPIWCPSTNIESVEAEILEYGEVEWGTILRRRAYNAEFFGLTMG
jgi:hypothetical protein